MKVTRTSLCHQRDKRNYLAVREHPLWAFIVDELKEFALQKVLRHRLCCRMPEFLWKIGYGWDEEWGLFDHSLGSLLYHAAGYSFSGKHEKEIAEVPLDDETFRRYWPREFLSWDDMFSQCGDGCGVTHDQYECREYWLRRLAHAVSRVSAGDSCPG